MMGNRTDWQPTLSLSNLQTRARLIWQIRSFFHDAGFDEVQTPVLSQDTVIDRHIDPVVVPGAALGLGEFSEVEFFLQTSPEFGMKRLLAAGAERIYQISPVFRAGERGREHNPEFTMLEWYRVGDDFAAATGLLRDLVHSVRPVWQPTELTYQQAFQQFADLCPLAATVNELAVAAMQRHHLSVSLDWSHDRDDWLNLLFAEVVQPQLGKLQPTIVTHYPASQSALAQICASDNRVAERFELFIGGVELANGYHELLDARELVARNQVVAAQRAADGKAPLPASSRLIAAMHSGLRPCSGCALGLDRLLMVLTNANSIDEVISFPIERA